MKRILALLLVAASTTFVAHAATVVATAQNYNGISLLDGSALPGGDIIRVGLFNLTDAQIQANQGNLSFLNNNFVQFGVAHSGDTYGIDGYFATTLQGSTDSLGIAGGQIYFWALNATSLANANQQSIFYFTGNPEWTFKADGANPNSSGPDVSDLTGGTNALLPAAHLVVGTFPGGNSAAFPGAKNFNLVAVVPEPSCVLLLGAGALGLLARRRRNS
jgi:hypothetical protein